MLFMRSVLSVVLRLHRLCEPANPAFTMSDIRENNRRANALAGLEALCVFRRFVCRGVWLVEPIGIEPMTSSLQS